MNAVLTPPPGSPYGAAELKSTARAFMVRATMVGSAGWSLVFLIALAVIPLISQRSASLRERPPIVILDFPLPPPPPVFRTPAQRKVAPRTDSKDGIPVPVPEPPATVPGENLPEQAGVADGIPTEASPSVPARSRRRAKGLCPASTTRSTSKSCRKRSRASRRCIRRSPSTQARGWCSFERSSTRPAASATRSSSPRTRFRCSTAPRSTRCGAGSSSRP